MKIAIGGLMHESNTFSPVRTERAAFGVKVGEEILAHWAEAHHEMGGFIEGARRFGYELCPTLMAGATPAGPVADEALEEFTQEILTRTRRSGAEGLLLALHGALVTEGWPDGDGEVLARLRAGLGPDFPIVATLDYHANISPAMVEHSTALVVYQTYPHVDQRQRGLRAAQILAQTVAGTVRPTQALAQPPLIVPIRGQETAAEPMRSILAQARALEEEAGLLAANVAGGFAYADVPEMGTSVVIVTDGDPDRARAEADRLSRRIWEVREQFKVDLPGPAEAVAQAAQAHRTPVVLVDYGDNVGGGSAGDGTYLLREILAQGVSGAVVVLAAPQEVQQCIAAGVRNPVELVVGGKIDRFHGEPVAVRGRVRALHEGLYTETEPRHGGQRFHDQGLTAVVEIEGPNTLVLTSRREPPFSLEQLRSLGLAPERQRILVVKAAIAYKAAYAPIAGTIIEADTPGLTACNPARFTYHRIRRPLFPLDEF